MSKSIQLKNSENEKIYPHPYFPIGFIVMTMTDDNPSKYFGGTWEQVAKGRTLVGVDTSDTDFNIAGKTGGSKTHKLTVKELPSHKHNGLYWYTVANTIDTGGSSFRINISYDGLASTSTQFSTGNTGGGSAFNITQPYFTCYIWCRTA